MTSTRTERDSLGTVEVPADALYGAQTARALQNFPISGDPMPPAFLRALATLKRLAASEHRRAGRLEPRLARAIEAAARELEAGRHGRHLPVDVFQTGSGTSSNMNVNEVLARRAHQLLEEGPEEPCRVHPNDHVNLGQSSNDVVPGAMHVAVALGLERDLLPALASLEQALQEQARQLHSVVKVGRTHLMDAVPVRMGPIFAGYAAQVANAMERIRRARHDLEELALGGTAVGTGLNAPPGFAEGVCARLAEETGLDFRRAADPFEAQGARDAALAASAALRGTALALGRIASDIRLMASGPRCGLGELALPAVQPGSSIMPGKVNPVICEAVIQVACQVVGYDAAVTAGATGGVGSLLELNVALPLLTRNLLEPVRLLTGAARTFEERCIQGLRADVERCNELVERSLSRVTALVPRLGYDRSAALAGEALRTGRTLRELALEQGLLSVEELDALLDARSQAGE